MSSGKVTPLADRAALRSAISRCSPASSGASQRATSTAWVFEARSSHQPSLVLTRTPSMSVNLAPACLQARLDLLDDAELALVGAVEAQLGRVDRLGQPVAHLGQALLAVGHDVEQPQAAIERVVEAVEAVGEEDVPAHLAGQRRA